MDLRDQLQATLGTTYTLDRELGGGGMSRVFVADETRLGRKVVVKVLSPELAAGISAERFEREIKVAASLQQANIVPVLSAGGHGFPDRQGDLRLAHADEWRDPDAAGDLHRDARVHLAGAGGRRSGGRSPRRHLLLRLHGVRVARRPSAVHRPLAAASARQ